MPVTASLNGKTALVTGASRGIGQAIAIALAQAGAVVGVHYAGYRDGAEETLRLIHEAGGRAFIVQAAFGNDGAIASLVDQLQRGLAETGYSGLDILVNNAGVGAMASITDTDEALLDQLLAVNVKAPFMLTRAVLPILRDGGRVINISSMVSVAAYSACIAYAMSKSAVNSFTTSLAVELGARGITVNAIAPGATNTDFIGSLRDDAPFMAAISNMTVLNRIGEPTDIASVAVFLASAAGGWMTGQVLQASGGMHL
jgi:3-oxoacyl-[acyl-carrier protein] reductase